MSSADRTAYELAELAIGDRLENDISDADGFLRLAAAIEAAPEEVALALAEEIHRFVDSARESAGLRPGCGDQAREDCPCRVVRREWEPDDAE